MNIFKTAIGWLWTFSATVFAIALFTRHWETGVLLCLSALATFPPMYRYIEQAFGKKIVVWFGIRIALAFFLFAAAQNVEETLTTPQERLARIAEEKREAADAARNRAEQDAEAKRANDESVLKRDERMAFSVCEVEIKDRLRDPDSAEFPSDYDAWYTAQQTQNAAEHKYTALVKVRAANGFGGKTISIFICTVQHTNDDHWPLISLQETNLDAL